MKILALQEDQSDVVLIGLPKKLNFIFNKKPQKDNTNQLKQTAPNHLGFVLPDQTPTPYDHQKSIFIKRLVVDFQNPVILYQCHFGYVQGHNIFMKFVLIAILIIATLQGQTTIAASAAKSAIVASNKQGPAFKAASASSGAAMKTASTASTASLSTTSGSSSSSSTWFNSGCSTSCTPPPPVVLPPPVTPPADWTFLTQNPFEGCTWQTPVPGNAQIYPMWWMTVYTIVYNSDTVNPVVLSIASTGYFQVYLNGSLIKDWQNPWPSTSTIKFKPLCGCNTLTIAVWNCWFGSPSAIAYLISQDNTGAYDCPVTVGATFYNRNTCRCECAATGCLNKPLTWVGYPKCNCECAKAGNDASCNSGSTTITKFWNGQTCSCQCKKVCCDAGYQQSPTTCKCVKSTTGPSGIVALTSDPDA